ncbi:MAG: hypothetical protein WBV71_09330, partial [Roseobacter sp.]
MFTISKVTRQGLFSVAVVFAASAPAVAANFETIDKNGDNKLQSEEMIDVFGDRAKAFIERWDQDGTGDLTRREVRQSNKKASAERNERQEDQDRSAPAQNTAMQTANKAAPAQAVADDSGAKTAAESKAERKAERQAKRAAARETKAAARAEKQAERKA